MVNDKCLTTDELNLFLNDEMSSEKRAKSDTHLSLCASCCHRLAQIYKESQPEPELIRAPRRLTARVLREPQPRLTRLFAWLFDFRWQTVAATVAVLIITSSVVFIIWPDANNTRTPITDPLREAAPLTIAPRLIAPENEAEINIAQAEFRWAKVEGISRYNFTLLDQRGNIVLQTSTSEERLSLSSSSVSLESGKPYFWHVTTQMNDGTEADSETRKIVFVKK
jgi:hypothetical protein